MRINIVLMVAICFIANICFNTKAQEALTIDGICYVLSEKWNNGIVEATAKVAASPNATGAVKIPSYVSIEGKSTEYTVIGIEDNAFEGNSSISNVEISIYGTFSIGQSAFKDCSSLESIMFLSSSSFIVYNTTLLLGEGCFQNNQKLTSFDFVEAIPRVYLAVGSHAFDNCTTLSKFASKTAVCLNALGEYAFYRTNIPRFEFEGDFSTIGTSAFAHNESLESIDFSNSVKVTAIEKSAFSWCNSLKSISLPPALQTIGDGVFSHTGIETISFPGSVTYIGQQTFFDCRKLRSVIFEDGISPITLCNNKYSDGIGGGLFEHCSNLTNAVIGRDITFSKWPNYSLSGAIALFNNNSSTGASLTELTITNAVTKLPPYFLYDCTNLTTLNVPASVTSIGESALSGSGLVSLIMEGKIPPVIVNSTFSAEQYKNLEVTVPYRAANAYTEDDCWKKFTNLSEAPSDLIPVNLKINACGSITHEVKPDEPFYLTLDAAPGWAIHTITINGESADIPNGTSHQLVLNNLMAPQDIAVVWVATPTETEEVESDNLIKVCVVGSAIHITGKTSEEQVNIFEISGQLVYNGYDDKIQLSSGIYIMTIGKRSYKFCV